MNPPAWIGADPGMSGAIALLIPNGLISADVCVTDVPALDGIMDFYALAATLKSWAETYDVQGATVERVGSMPEQGVTSSFNFGYAAGALAQAIASAGVRITFVRPQTWKAIYGLRGGRENKAASAKKAEEFFPQLRPLLYGPRGGVKDGRAEAVLLARYGSQLRSNV